MSLRGDNPTVAEAISIPALHGMRSRPWIGRRIIFHSGYHQNHTGL
jgi:hypothetical protein